MLAGHGHVGERNDQLAAFDPVLHQIEPPHGDAKVPRGGQHREIGAVELHAFTVGIQPQRKVLRRGLPLVFAGVVAIVQQRAVGGFSGASYRLCAAAYCGVQIGTIDSCIKASSRCRPEGSLPKYIAKSTPRLAG